MKIALGSDHGGFFLKKIVLDYLLKEGYEVEDCGTYNEESVTYADYGILVGEKVRDGKVDRGIVICGSGVGISIAANKVVGVRCALVSEPYSARLSREHNDANVLALGARLIGPDMALEIIKTWLITEFEQGRHVKRIKVMTDYEE